jgi:hypothetical protein
MNYYLSDCNNAYYVAQTATDSNGNPPYTDPTTACSQCDSFFNPPQVPVTVANLQAANFTRMGPCSEASSQDDGSGYLSPDGVSYYQDPNGYGDGNNSGDHGNPNEACLNFGGTMDDPSAAQCTSENFEMFGMTDGKSMAMIVLLVLIIAAIIITAYMLTKKKTN